MGRLVAISISLLAALSLYAFNHDQEIVQAPPAAAVEAEETVEEPGGETVVFSSAARRASSSSGGGGRRDSKQLGRKPICVTPRRGCGFTLQKDDPAPRQAPAKSRGWLSFRD
jgi:hypothetical protein